MPSYVTPKKGVQYITFVGLVSQADTKLLKVNPTIAAGDFKVSIDGGALANLATLPVVTPAASTMVKITLSTSEMNGDNVTVVCSDASGAEWCDLLINIQTSARQVDDLAWPTTAGRSIDVTTTGGVGIDWANVENPTTALNLSATTIATSQAVASVSGAVGSVTAGVTVTTNNDKTGYGLTALESASLHSGTAQAGASSTITLAAGASSTDGLYVGEAVKVYGGTGAGQARVITAYNGTTKVATVDRVWAVNPASDSTYAVLATALAKLDTSLHVTAASVQGSVTGAVASVTGNVGGNVTGNVSGSVGSVATGGITAASFGAGAIDNAAIATDAIGSAELAASAVTEIQTGLATAAALVTAQADLDDIQTRLPAALISGRMDASVGSMAANVMTAAAAAADLTTELQTGLATAASITTLTGYVDTEVAAIKAKTDNLPAAPAAVGDIPTAIQNADALLDRSGAIETGLTVRQAFRLALAALAGKVSGATTTTVTIRNAVADSKDRLVATVDADGNRTNIVTDVT